MNQITIPFTKEAFEKIQADILRLSKERAEILIRLQTAREMGDLSENGAYKYAKFELGNVSRQLRQLHYLARFGKVTPKATSGTVGFGNQVTLEQGHKQMTYMLVSQYESDPNKGKVSLESPLGQALLDKKPGDTITVTTPRGSQIYLLLKIE